MILHSNVRGQSALLLFLAFAFFAAVSGCDRGPPMAHVSGKVLYKDGSVPRAGVCVVRFEPEPNSSAEVRRGASGAIGPDGSFEMMTRMEGDGVYYGDYAVTFAILKGPMDPTSLILPKYTAKSMTPYKVTIDGDKTDLHYEIEPLPGVSGAAASGAKAATSAPTSG
jgi:hypothetical protein